MEPLKVDFENNVKCKFCGKKATKLCDVVTGVKRYAGHPPIVDGKMVNAPMESNITCDKKICDKCAIHINEHMDICPDCYRDIQVKKRG